jgi:hypothetical protein
VTELVRALCSCVGDERRRKARRFLQGLSGDELQYIAEFIGSCILEAEEGPVCASGHLAEDVAAFERSRRAARARPKGRRHTPAFLPDEDHKMILLLEYLNRCGTGHMSLARAARM